MTVTKDFSSWDQFKRDYASALSGHDVRRQNFVFRGQADARWAIQSSFDRVCPPDVAERHEYYCEMVLFFAFQLRQYGEDLDRFPIRERAAIAQHYGMPTRLIDWSRSPYVAAFMAFFSAITENRIEVGNRVAIWALDADRFRAAAAVVGLPFEVVQTRLLQNDRVWRQAGLFIEATANEDELDRFLSDSDDDCGLVRFTIPTIDAVAALNDMILMGLTPASMFPDRDGAAKYVRLRLALDRAEARAGR